MPSRERTETVTEADGPTDAGCRTIRAEESQDVLGRGRQGERLRPVASGLTATTQSGIAGGKRSVPLY